MPALSREVHHDPGGSPRCRVGRHAGSPGPRVRRAAPRDRASRSEGARPHRLRRVLHVAVAAARLPDRARTGPGIRHRGHRRQPLPGFLRRDRGQRHRPLPPAGRGGHRSAGVGAAPLQRLGFLPADLRAPRGRAGADRADARPDPRLPGQLRDRGGGGGDQAGPLCDRAPVHRGLPGRLPRPHVRERQPHRLEGQVPRPLRPAAARHLPRAVRVGRPG